MSNKVNYYKISVSSYGDETLGDVREEIARVNKEKFGGKPILKLTNQCRFELSYDNCYYESDSPSIIILIPYKKSP
jgi:hypothetical protein